MSAAKVEERMLPVEVDLPVAGLGLSVPIRLRFLRRLLRRGGPWMVAAGIGVTKVMQAVLRILLLIFLVPRPAGS